MTIAKIHSKISHHQISERSNKSITIEGKQYVPIQFHSNKHQDTYFLSVRSRSLLSSLNYGSIKYHIGQNANSKPKGSFMPQTKTSNESRQ